MSSLSNIMTAPIEVIEHIAQAFPLLKDAYDALAYQYLLKKHGVKKTIEDILIDEPYIGLLGQQDEFETFHNIRFLRLHAILHDTYGRVYNKYGFDRGYIYCFNAPRWLRGNPFLGHVTGF